MIGLFGLFGLFALGDLVDLFLHLDQHLNEWAGVLGPWLYLVLFAIVFCETGLVVTPFLPGDSLLFAVGALAATEGSPINVALVWVLLLVAGVLGDAVNYSIGYRLGPRVFSKTDSKIFNREHLLRTQHFYEKYGGKTIFLARFVPIIRTFAPVRRRRRPHVLRAVRDVQRHRRLHLGDALPVRRLLFGNLPVVANNFSLVILAIIGLSLLPIAIEFLKARAERRRAPVPPAA